MKRRCLRGLIVVLLAAITFVLPLLASSHRIDKVHRNLIREGMTLAEVEGILGAPAGDYDFAVIEESLSWKIAIYEHLMHLRMAKLVNEPGSEDARISKLNANLTRWRKAECWQSWTGRHGAFTVGFDENGRVTWVGGMHKTRVEPPWERWWKKLTAK